MRRLDTEHRFHALISLTEGVHVVKTNFVISLGKHSCQKRLGCSPETFCIDFNHYWIVSCGQ